MKLTQLESALRKAGTELDAAQKQLAQSEKTASIADRKSTIARQKYKHAKKEARQARKEARLGRKGLNEAREILAARMRAIGKVETKLLKARKKSLKTTAARPPQKSRAKNPRPAMNRKGRSTTRSRKASE